MNNITIKICSLLFFLLIIIVACDNTPKPEPDPDPNPEPMNLTANSFSAVPMPSTLSTGEPFPTDSTIVNGWVEQSQTNANHLEMNKDMMRHGWGIWSALTEITSEFHNGQPLRRFETWYTPQDIINAYKIQSKNSDAKLVHVDRGRGNLARFNQFNHGQPKSQVKPTDLSVLGFVKYDPVAAYHIYNNRLLYKSVLDSYKKPDGFGKIPEFPLGGISLKPVFSTLDSINPATGNYILQVWPGEEGDNNRSWGPSDWGNTVEVTIDGQTDTTNRIYSINDFIHFQIDSIQAAEIKNNNPQLPGEAPKTGDYAILVGMHVTSKENVRWTWQTFWWSERPSTPHIPSTTTTARFRATATLDHAARHYAMGIAYNMVQKAQPDINSDPNVNNDNNSVYAYNPYLEAGFDQSQFTHGNQIVSETYSPDYAKVNGTLNDWGMQTNCMSCHIQATAQGDKGYLADQYVSMEAPYFRGSVTLDFSWSIQGNIIDDNGDKIE